MIRGVPSSSTVHTPDPLAQAMVRALGDKPRAAWLDPCAGQAAFARALTDLGVERKRILALDLDPTPSPNDAHARVRRGVDFIDWSTRTTLRFDRVILNPPYVALSRLKPALRNAALTLKYPDAGPISKQGNYWAAFLLGAIRTLSPRGALCAVLPAAWDFARYAAPLRVLFQESFGTVEVFRSFEPLFGDVQDGSVVIVARDYGAPDGWYRRTELATGAELIAALNQGGGGSSNVLVTPQGAKERREARRTVVRFSEVMRLRLGGVTGDSDYFLLTESERRLHRLPVDSLRPVVTRSRHLQGAWIDRNAWNALRSTNERVWLFRPGASALKKKRVRSYLLREPGAGGCDRTRMKVRSRVPWHRTVLPRGPHGFMSGMARVGPHLVLNRTQGLSATNTLYVVTFLQAATLAERAAWGLSLLTTRVRKALKSRGRTYARGLVKYEPGDLADLELPIPPSVRGAATRLKEATARLLEGDAVAASRIADSFFSLAEATDRSEDTSHANAAR